MQHQNDNASLMSDRLDKMFIFRHIQHLNFNFLPLCCDSSTTTFMVNKLAHAAQYKHSDKSTHLFSDTVQMVWMHPMRSSVSDNDKYEFMIPMTRLQEHTCKTLNPLGGNWMKRNLPSTHGGNLILHFAQYLWKRKFAGVDPVPVHVFRQIRNLDHFGTCTTSVRVSRVPGRYIPLRYIVLTTSVQPLRYNATSVHYMPRTLRERPTVGPGNRRRLSDDLLTLWVELRCWSKNLIKLS